MQLWQSLCNSRPLSPHNWPCRHIQCGDHGKCDSIARSRLRHHDTSRHTLQNKGQRLYWPLVFIHVFFITYVFLSCSLAHPSGTEQYCAILGMLGRCFKTFLVQYVMPHQLTSCITDLILVPPVMKVFFVPFNSNFNFSSFNLLFSKLDIFFLLFSIPPNLKRPSSNVNVCF